MTWEFGRIVLLCLLNIPIPIGSLFQTIDPDLLAKVFEHNCVCSRPLSFRRNSRRPPGLGPTDDQTYDGP